VSRLLRLALIPLALVLLGATPAHAVLPAGKSRFEVHDHSVPGKNWHIEFEINKTGRKIKTAVLYREDCKETPFAEGIPIAEDGSFTMGGPLPKNRGIWSVTGKFETTEHAHGVYTIQNKRCDTGEVAFDAHTGAGHMMIGNMAEYPTALNTGGKNVRRVRNLRMRSVRSAKRFADYRRAQKLGYYFGFASMADTRCPGLNHMRKHDVDMWGETLDPRNPQSLVYWCDSSRKMTLAAFMFRAWSDTRPPTFGDLLQWHKHGEGGNWMTHLWLVPDTRAAIATCAPFEAFERFGLFKYEPYYDILPIDFPCSDTPRLAPDAPRPGHHH
jgi:hypothetical protein